MRPQKRYRVLSYLIVAGIVTLLFFRSQSRDANTRAVKDFHSKTVHAMDKNPMAGAGAQAGQKVAANHDVDADGDIDQDDEALARQMADRLRQAEKEAKDSAAAKGPNKPQLPEEVIGVGSSASGQKPVAEVQDETEAKEPEDDHKVEEALQDILKKSPVIIFSKSYCPFSKTAKGILLEKYTIEPAPYVVELDQHPLGPRIQERVGDMTGRRTVPNILIYGQSIGGGDEISAMDRERSLAHKISLYAGTRISVSLRFEQTAEKAG